MSGNAKALVSSIIAGVVAMFVLIGVVQSDTVTPEIQGAFATVVMFFLGLMTEFEIGKD